MSLIPSVPGSARCPDRDTLFAFHHGQIPEDALPTIAHHLTLCKRCTIVLSLLKQDQTPLPPGFAPPESQVLHQTITAVAPPEAAVGAPPPAPPSQLRQYELLEMLAQGGMGSVYRARHLHLDKFVAVKTLRLEKCGGTKMLDRFRREMKAVGSLNHPNIVQALDGGEENGWPFLVMELVEGLDLHRLLVRVGPLAVADACEIIRQSALGLQHVQEAGLVHRDIKPSNLFLTMTGQVKVLDLGLSRQWTMTPEPGAEPLTESGQLMGTADFMAPEQGLDAHAADIRSDLYSLGCTFYKLLTGHAPFESAEYSSSTKKVLAHLLEKLPPIAPHRPDLPNEVETVVNQLTAKEPLDRPATPAEVAAALGPFAKGADLAALITRAQGALERESPPPGNPGPNVTTRDLRGKKMFPPAGQTRLDQKPRRGSHPVWWMAAGVLALAAALVGAWSQVPPPQAVQEGRLPGMRTRWTPGVLYHLLDRPPLMPERDHELPRTTWQYLDQTQELVVTSGEIHFTPLGKVEDWDYTLSVNISQNASWTGGTGLYFGYQEKVINRVKGKQFFTVELRPYKLKDPKVPFQIVWYKHWHPEEGELSSDVATLNASRVAWPPTDAVLEITVRGNHLGRVRWNNTELPGVTGPIRYQDLKFTPADFDGEFGFYTSQCSSTYFHSNFRVFERQR